MKLIRNNQLSDLDSNLLTLPAKSLLTPRRLDIALKWRLFRHILGGDDQEAVDLYFWHIAKRRADGFIDSEKNSPDDYRDGAMALAESMSQFGFDSRYPIPLDKNGEILGGAHRLGCALALDIDVVTLKFDDKEAWAPDWGHRWFREHGFPNVHRKRLLKDFDNLLID